jgi:hypothetical protein
MQPGVLAIMAPSPYGAMPFEVPIYHNHQPRKFLFLASSILLQQHKENYDNGREKHSGHSKRVNFLGILNGHQYTLNKPSLNH